MYQLSISSIFLFLALSCFSQSASQKMGSVINLPNCSVSSPELTFDGQSLLLTINGHRQNVGYEDLDDIWVSRFQKGQWGHSINLGAPINNRQQDRVVGIAADGMMLYLMDENGTLKTSKKDGRFWSRPIPFNIPNISTIGTAKDYSISLNANTILIAIEKIVDNQSDLYVSFRKGENEWTTPKSLGTQVNSGKDEVSVFLSLDGKSIYFSSNGFGGEGGFDLYKSQRLDGSWENWSTPENLGPNINSNKDELSCTLSAKAEVLIYEVASTNGLSEIYTAELPKRLQPEPVVILKGKIQHTDLTPVSESALQVQSLESFNKRLTISADQDGTFKCVVPFGESVGIYAQTEGYFSQSKYVGIANQQLEELDYDNPEITADLSQSETYKQREIDIAQLRERLKKIDSKLEEFGELRTSYENQAIADRRARAAKGETFYQTDAELDALKNRYDNFMQNTELGEDAKANFYTPEQYEFLQDTIIPNQQKKKKGDDRELAQMRQRYKNYYLKKKGRLPGEEKEEEGMMWEDGLSPNQPKDLQAKSGKTLTETPGVAALQLPDSYAAAGNRIETDTSAAEPLKSFLAGGFNKKESEKKQDWQTEFDLQSNTGDKQQVSEEKMKNEIYLQSIRNEEDQLKQELEAKVRQQIIEEQQTGYRGNAKLPASNNLIKEQEQELPTYQEVEEEITLIPIQIGKTIQLNNIFFKPNSAILKPYSFQELERVLDFLKSNPKVVVELASHTNGDLSHTFAMQLSNKRAKAIQDYLLSNGIPEVQIIAQGYGKTMPLVAEDSTKNKRQNQRIEMKIIELND